MTTTGFYLHSHWPVQMILCHRRRCCSCCSCLTSPFSQLLLYIMSEATNCLFTLILVSLTSPNLPIPHLHTLQTESSDFPCTCKLSECKNQIYTPNTVYKYLLRGSRETRCNSHCIICNEISSLAIMPMNHLPLTHLSFPCAQRQTLHYHHLDLLPHGV